jgi:glycyl-tRNA synthetase
MQDAMEKVVSLCKRRGFIFQNSEIYGGLASTWDYGPLGAELKRNVKNVWWKSIVYERGDIEGVDAAILMHPQTWVASGHIKSFFDLLVDCKNCKKRFKLQELCENGKKKIEEMNCPFCGASSFTKERLLKIAVPRSICVRKPLKEYSLTLTMFSTPPTGSSLLGLPRSVRPFATR